MGFLEFQTVGFGQHRAAVDDIRLRDFQFDRKKEMSLVFGPRLFPSVPRCCLRARTIEHYELLVESLGRNKMLSS